MAALLLASVLQATTQFFLTNHDTSKTVLPRRPNGVIPVIPSPRSAQIEDGVMGVWLTDGLSPTPSTPPHRATLESIQAAKGSGVDRNILFRRRNHSPNVPKKFLQEIPPNWKPMIFRKRGKRSIANPKGPKDGETVKDNLARSLTKEPRVGHVWKVIHHLIDRTFPQHGYIPTEGIPPITPLPSHIGVLPDGSLIPIHTILDVAYQPVAPFKKEFHKYVSPWPEAEISVPEPHISPTSKKSRRAHAKEEPRRSIFRTKVSELAQRRKSSK